MTEEQSDRIVELLTDIRDQLNDIGTRVESIETRIDSFGGLSELADLLERELIISISDIGETFHEKLSEKLVELGEDVGGKLDRVADKLDDIDSSIGDLSP